jgi:endonuclease YncB( thermonuclease family)
VCFYPPYVGARPRSCPQKSDNLQQVVEMTRVWLLTAATISALVLSAVAAQAQTYDRVAVMRVIDGDTFEARVEVWPDVIVATSVRLLGVDAPELRGKCPGERALALRAYAALEELLRHLPVTLGAVKHDKFAGRVDATVTAGGVDVAKALIGAGLARSYDGGARQGWCE